MGDEAAAAFAIAGGGAGSSAATAGASEAQTPSYPTESLDAEPPHRLTQSAAECQ